MFKYLFALLICFAFFALPAYSGTVKPAKFVKNALKIKPDTSAVYVRSFDARRIAGYLKDKDFRYNKADVPGESLWDRFWHWFWDWLNRKIFSSSASNNFFYYLFLILGAVFLIYIISRISGLDKFFLFRGNAKQVILPYSESLENIHEINFEAEIEKAISNHNYRLAVRMLYLYSLKQLNDARLINWQIEKTNSVYLNEIPEGEQRQLFALLTHQFEYVWYGNFQIDVQSFQNISSLFKQLKQQIR